MIRRATYDEAKSLKEFDEFIGERRTDNSRGELFIYLDEGRIAGYINFSSSQFNNRPFIALLYVREEFRRRGIGRALLHRVMELYSEIDLWISTEDSNRGAQLLFESVGFEYSGALKGLNRDGSVELFYLKSGSLNV